MGFSNASPGPRNGNRGHATASNPTPATRPASSGRGAHRAGRRRHGDRDRDRRLRPTAGRERVRLLSPREASPGITTPSHPAFLPIPAHHDDGVWRRIPCLRPGRGLARPLVVIRGLAREADDIRNILHGVENVLHVAVFCLHRRVGWAPVALIEAASRVFRSSDSEPELRLRG